MVEKQPTIMSQEVPSTTEVVIPPKVQSEPAIVILECPPENAHDDSTEGDMHSVCIEHDQHIDSNKNCSLKDRNLERDKDSFDDELSNSDDAIIVPFAQGKINHDKEDNADAAPAAGVISNNPIHERVESVQVTQHTFKPVVYEDMEKIRKDESPGDRETSDEAGVCETNVQLSDIPNPCEDLSQIFPNGFQPLLLIATLLFSCQRSKEIAVLFIH
ncbi:hypothetical protein P8452_02476 [Trifolium repens]|nr:hypothetical protein P8452_02476 [Trifolium repens]